MEHYKPGSTVESHETQLGFYEPADFFNPNLEVAALSPELALEREAEELLPTSKHSLESYFANPEDQVAVQEALREMSLTGAERLIERTLQSETEIPTDSLEEILDAIEAEEKRALKAAGHFYAEQRAAEQAASEFINRIIDQPLEEERIAEQNAETLANILLPPDELQIDQIAEEGGEILAGLEGNREATDRNS